MDLDDHSAPPVVSKVQREEIYQKVSNTDLDRHGATSMVSKKHSEELQDSQNTLNRKKRMRSIGRSLTPKTNQTLYKNKSLSLGPAECAERLNHENIKNTNILV